MKIHYIIGLVAIVLLLSISGCKDTGEVVEEDDNGVSGATTSEDQKDATETEQTDDSTEQENQTDDEEEVDVKELYEQLSEEAGLNTEDSDEDNTSEESSEEATADDQTIVIDNFQGDPEDLDIKVGTTVTFVNEQENFQHVIGLRKEVNGMYSGNDVVDDWHPLLPGESYEYTFEDVGNYQWMSKSNYPDTTGEIVVTE